MALATLTMSGGWRLSATGGASVGNAFSVLSPLTAGLGAFSVWQQQTIVLAAVTSEFVVSFPTLSAPQAILATATGEVRINFAGQGSSFSAASASVMKFKELFAMVDVSGILASGIHLGNSGSDSATVVLLIAG